MTTFDFLKDIIKDKTGTLDQKPEFKKKWSSFMVIRWLSMDSRFREVAFKANELHDVLNGKQMYRYLVAAIPYDSNTYIGHYIKK